MTDIDFRIFSGKHTKDDSKNLERRKAVADLQEKIKEERRLAAAGDMDSARIRKMELDIALWQCIIAFQNYLFYTTTGLPFSYTVKKKKDGEYSGEMKISRKEESKTLTRSSVILAFHTVLDQMIAENIVEANGNTFHGFILPEYKGPKAIGQIFGISYVYSMFWNFGLIKVPEKIENKLMGKKQGEVR